MEETSKIKDIEEELKRLPESMATYNQLHEFEEMRAKRKQVKYRTRVKRILDRLKKRIKKQQEKQLKNIKKISDAKYTAAQETAEPEETAVTQPIKERIWISYRISNILSPARMPTEFSCSQKENVPHQRQKRLKREKCDNWKLIKGNILSLIFGTKSLTCGCMGQISTSGTLRLATQQKLLNSCRRRSRNMRSSTVLKVLFIERLTGLDVDPMPSEDPFRDLRGESKPKIKRENARIVELVDELLSEAKATASKVQRGLRRHGITISVSTVYPIAQDLSFGWTKPWHTDILTPAQKLK